MTSARKAAANRRNAKLSTGPRSAAGRERASLNALRHGLTARTALLPFEDRKAYDRAARMIFDQYRPVGAIEECLVDLIVADRWRLVRFSRIEDAYVVATHDRHIHPGFGCPPKSAHDTAEEQLRKIFGRPLARQETGVDVPCSEQFSASGSVPANNNHAHEIALVRIKQHLSDHNALLDAYVSRVSASPMAEIVRQRRQATRELLRNVFALETMQARRGHVPQGNVER